MSHMESPRVTTARRRPPRSDVGLKCIGAYFAFLALGSALVLVWAAPVYSESLPRSEATVTVAWGLGLAALNLFISIGLFRRVKIARWVAVFVSILMMFSWSIVGIAIFMYLIRPELDRVFA